MRLVPTLSVLLCLLLIASLLATCTETPTPTPEPSPTPTPTATTPAVAEPVMAYTPTPVIYYGEEIGMPGEKGNGNPYWDEYRREPLDWYAAEAGAGMTTWFQPRDRYNAPDDGISVEEQDKVADSLLNHYRALTALRHAHPALRSGAFDTVDVATGEGVYAYTRYAPRPAAHRKSGSW